MTTPALNTPFSIISDAYLDAKLIQEGQRVNSDQLVDGMRRLTDMINFWMTRGLKLWLNVDTAVTLVEDQALYEFKPSGDVDMTKPLRVLQGYWLSPQNLRTPLTVMAWEEYLRLSQVTGNSGALNSYFVDKQATSLNVFFWLTPDATAALGTAHVLLQTQVTTPINVTETMDFPVEWRMALRWGLADELAGGQPPAIEQRCKERAKFYRESLEDWDVEDAPTRFTPDSRGMYQGARFRR